MGDIPFQFSPSAVAAFLALAVAGFLYLRSTSVKETHQATIELADTRGKRVEDLESEVSQLRLDVAELRGAVRAIQDLKGQEIAAIVIEAIKGSG